MQQAMDVFDLEKIGGACLTSSWAYKYIGVMPACQFSRS